MIKQFSVSAYVRAVHDSQVKVLLVLHKKLNKYVPIGGRIEPGESPSDAIRREIKEEIGRDDGFFPTTQFEPRIPGLMGYDEHEAGHGRLHMNFSFLYDLQNTNIDDCSEWVWPTWFIKAPESSPDNVHRFVQLALNSPFSWKSR